MEYEVGDIVHISVSKTDKMLAIIIEPCNVGESYVICYIPEKGMLFPLRPGLITYLSSSRLTKLYQEYHGNNQ